MAKAVKKKSISKAKKSFVAPFSAYWTKTNYIIFFTGIAVIVLGFFFMSMGPWNSTASLDISPVLLIIGYLIILPLSILYTKKEAVQSTDNHETHEK
ncbi:MAG: hypothetical protein ACYCVH_09310 [Ignavibacteriaceae bacterium]